jgi:regulator of sigma E protease
MIVTILLGVVGLGLMVFIHELGHFVAAKMVGVDVEVFSLGWGPRLAGFRHKGTMYQVSWLPIGGYCKMKGELVPGIAGGGANAAPIEPLRVNPDGTPAALPPAPAAAPEQPKGSFLAASPQRRIVIALFGPFFNLLFALLAFTIIWWGGFRIYSSDNRIILASDYTLDTFAGTLPAAAAGLRTGDRITAIDGAPVEKFQDILEAVTVAPGQSLSVTVQRTEGGSPTTRNLRITPELDKNTGAGRIGIYAWEDPVIGTVTAGGASAIAGLHPGDRIVEIDGRPASNSIDLSQALAAKPKKLTLTIERGGVRDTVPLVLSYNESGAPNLGMGFAPVVFHSPRLGPLGALQKSGQETWNTVTLTVKGIGLLFQGIKVRNAVAGPLRITYYIGSAAASGFQTSFGAGLVQFFRFLAFLSVVLALMNLLPIPAMDGGQIIMFLIEIARGKPVRSLLIWRVQLIGFSLLIGLSLFVTFSDILFFMGR